MDDLSGSNGREIAVALVGNHHALRVGALERRCHRRSPPVRCLHVAHIKVIVGKHRAAHRTHKDRAVLHAHVRDGFCDELVHHAVAAAGAVVRLVLQFRLSFIGFEKDR